MAGIHDVYVFAEGNEFLVRPAVVAVSRSGKKLKVRNLTDYPITLTFREGVIEGNSCAVGAQKSADAEIGALADGIHEYTVDVALRDGTCKKAIGNSWPKIIVDP